MNLLQVSSTIATFGQHQSLLQPVEGLVKVWQFGPSHRCCPSTLPAVFEHPLESPQVQVRTEPRLGEEEFSHCANLMVSVLSAVKGTARNIKLRILRTQNAVRAMRLNLSFIVNLS